MVDCQKLNTCTRIEIRKSNVFASVQTGVGS